MLKGKELGHAIERAIQLKIDSGAVRSRAAVARALNVEPNVVYGWIRTGSISKERLPALWSFFEDVVEPEHWGLNSHSLESLARKNNKKDNWPFELTKLEDVLDLTQAQLQQLDHIMAGVLIGLRSNATPPLPLNKKKN